MKGIGFFLAGLGLLFIYNRVRQNNQLDNNVYINNVEQIPESNPYSFPTEKTNIFLDAFRAALASPQPVLPLSPIEPQAVLDPQTVEAANWLGKIRHPSIVLIVGKRGSGKSTLGYRLLEHLRWTASPFVVGLPKEAKKYLPDWLGMATNLEEVPLGSIILVDEGYLHYHARRSMSAASVEMSRILNLSRHRNQTLIFVTPEARQLDRNVVSSADIIIFKESSRWQTKYERPELNDMAVEAERAFATITMNKQRWSFVYSSSVDFAGLMENSLPSFWSGKLSRIFATGGEVVARSPKKMPLNQRIERAKELKRQGLSLGKIAKLMGVTKPTIKNYLEDYPYKA